MYGSSLVDPFILNKLHIASKHSHSHVVGLPDLGGLGSPAPVHLVLAQQLDLLVQDVVYGEPSDEHTGEG